MDGNFEIQSPASQTRHSHTRSIETEPKSINLVILMGKAGGSKADMYRRVQTQSWSQENNAL